jgi:H(+)-transporting ATP synthase subunit D
MIAPNKQNLILLKNQKKVTQNGYKLLKEKRAGLIVYFLKLSKQGKEREMELMQNSSANISQFEEFFGLYDTQKLNSYLTGTPSSAVKVGKKRISGVYVDSIELEVKSSARARLKHNVQTKLDTFCDILPSFIELSQLKLNCKHIADEILKTNRQIANLEKTIDTINSDIKYIRGVLSDKENLEKGILIKLFL